LLRGCFQTGFLIWGRASTQHSPVLPLSDIPPKVKKKKIKDQASSISASDSISEDTLLKVMKEDNIPEDIPQKVKKKIEAQASSLTTIDGSSENLLSQFSGEPQIVDFFTVSQLTPPRTHTRHSHQWIFSCP
jgi:hypothetical protein